MLLDHLVADWATLDQTRRVLKMRLQTTTDLVLLVGQLPALRQLVAFVEQGMMLSEDAKVRLNICEHAAVELNERLPQREWEHVTQRRRAII